MTRKAMINKFEDGLGIADALSMLSHARVLRTSEGGSEEADRLEDDATEILERPVAVTMGNGGEVVTLSEHREAQQQAAIDKAPTALDAEASHARLALIGMASVNLALTLEAASSSGAETSLEKMLVHEAVAAHTLAMRFIGCATNDVIGFENTGYKHANRNVEACRSANTATRLMQAVANAAAALKELQRDRKAATRSPTLNMRVTIDRPSRRR